MAIQQQNDIISAMNYLTGSIEKLYAAMTHANSNQFGQLYGTNGNWPSNNPFSSSGFFGDTSFLLKDLTDFTEKQKEILRAAAVGYSENIKKLSDTVEQAEKEVKEWRGKVRELREKSKDLTEAQEKLHDAEVALAKAQKDHKEALDDSISDIKNQAEGEVLQGQWDRLSLNEQKSFGGFESFSNFQRKLVGVNEKKQSLSEYDNIMGSLGLNKGIVKTGINMMNQSNNLSLISSRLSGGAEGGAQGIASRLGFGETGGKILGGLGKAAGGLSSALGGVGKLLGGPWAAALQVGIEAVKMFAQAVAAANQYISQQMANNSDIARMEFEKQKALKQKSFEIQASEAQFNADVLTESQKTANEMLKKGAETSAEIEVKGAELAAQKRIMSAELAASTLEKTTGVITSQFTDGINAAAWSALQSKIELGTLAKEQDIETRKLESKYGIETRKLNTEFDIAKEQATQSLDTSLEKMQGLYENQLGVLGLEYAQTQRGYDADILTKATTADIEQSTNWGGRLADFAGLGDATGVGINDITDDLKEGIATPTSNGERINAYNSQERLMNDSDANKMRRLAEQTTWATGMMDSLLGTGEADKRKQAIKSLGDQMKFETEWETVLGQGGAKLANIEIEKQASIKQMNIETSSAIKSTWANAQQEMANINVETAATIEKRWTVAGKNIETMWMGMAKHMEETTGDYDSLTNDIGIMMGYTTPGQLVSMQHDLIDSVRQMSKYGVDIKEAMAMRQGYIEATNRNIQFTEGDNSAMGGLYKLLGHDSGVVAQYTGGMEIFNKGVNASVDLLNKAMKTTNKMGLNGRQFAKEIVNNLKMAQKYNFKDGTEGLMRMTQWAMKTRFNMQSIGSMIDNVLEGGLEGVIEQSSRLQVLGGNAAIYSDPFSMMFNAASSAEDFGQQVLNMTKGLGYIDRKTGETRFNFNEEFMLRNIAKTLGMDVGELKDIRRSANRRDSVNLAMTAEQKARFNKDQLDYIGNVAHYSQEKGGFFVNVKNNKGEYEEVGVNELSPEQIKALEPVEHEERVEDYMKSILSGVERIASAEIFTKTDISNQLLEPYLENMKNRAEAALKNYADMGETYVSKALEMSLKATNEYKGILEAWENNTNQASAEADRLARASNSAASALENLWRRVEALNISSGNPTIPNPNSMVHDAYVAGNGRSFFGRASQVTPINDGFIANPADEGLIGKHGGWVDTLVNNMYSMLSDMHNGGNMGINVNGSLMLTSNGNSIDIINTLRNDPSLVREITTMIFRQGRVNSFGGRGDHPYNDGSRNTYI